MNRPWMPLYVADYRADTAHLNAAQHGAYLLLIMHYWQTGSLPVDDAPLARIACMGPAEWRRVKPIVQAFFDDGWKHKRIEAELTRAIEISSKRAASAKQRHSNSSANAKQEHTHARASPQSQSPSEEAQEASSGARKRATRLANDWWPTGENVEYALAKGLSLNRVNLEAEKFRNHWTAKSGRDAAKMDWDATWQNWILRALEAPNGHGRTRNETLEQRGERLAEQARQLEFEAGVRRPDDGFGSH